MSNVFKNPMNDDEDADAAALANQKSGHTMHSRLAWNCVPVEHFDRFESPTD